MTLVFLEPTLALDVVESPHDVTGDVPGVVRFGGVDLSTAQARYRRLRTEHPDARILVDLDVHLAHDARTARGEVLAAAVAPRPDTLRYVGTPAGLAGLIADIVAAGVADGVTVRPVLDRARDRVVRTVTTEVASLLDTRTARAS
ncbi:MULTISPECIES: hypothetical protein [Nocardiaceae]|uniref:Luciferase-like monooxygenase n=1 Tax=Rhodococcoides kroppenstedtii TaxID=293050 RepID=A0A1I0TU38_9NOCA|nr:MULTISPECIES: hypothetical protein [Rhodococcus]AMY20638.1 hypothetical protein A3Q40_03277 [Rhodococcus sp. PBTS 1]MBT1191719.1 hypothetical protein [Rhodococcus kroppenstedtii]MBY6313303.1 hypothetical protein [Rhodococcus kroppenstedtii]MBY6321194.1 hypothetical protein [Rhodococcus kroppenstedtii]MBY6400387.1 hypothetical protein [Rhodococcus kroppenstedtii]